MYYYIRYMKLTNLFSRILTGMCLAVCLTACEKNYYTEVVEEADNEEIPMRDLHVEALSQSWFATRGTDYISPLFTYLAPSISKYYKMGTGLKIWYLPLIIRLPGKKSM